MILGVSSLLMISPAFAQSTKPSVPEFTLKYVDHTADSQPSAELDPYHGNKTVDVTIKNQPFTSYLDANGNSVSLYYNIRFKSIYMTEWRYYADLNLGYLKAQPTDYTVISLQNTIVLTPEGGTVDVQVQALIGVGTLYGAAGLYKIQTSFDGAQSDWSNTQSVTKTLQTSNPTTPPNTLPTSLPATSNPTNYTATNPTLTPQLHEAQTDYQLGIGWEQTAIGVLIVLVAGLLVVVGLLWRKISKK
jgi:hypothetical protein